MKTNSLIRLNRSQTTGSALSLLCEFLAQDRVYRQFISLFSAEKASYAVLRDASMMLSFDEVHIRFLVVLFSLFVHAGEENRKEEESCSNGRKYGLKIMFFPLIYGFQVLCHVFLSRKERTWLRFGKIWETFFTFF